MLKYNGLTRAQAIDKFKENDLKYARLTKDQSIEKLKEVELNADLTVDQKIHEFNMIAQGQVCGGIGASYILKMPDELVLTLVNYNILKYRVQTSWTFYEPSNETLPTIIMCYDYGRLVDLIDEPIF